MDNVDEEGRCLLSFPAFREGNGGKRHSVKGEAALQLPAVQVQQVASTPCDLKSVLQGVFPISLQNSLQPGYLRGCNFQ